MLRTRTKNKREREKEEGRERGREREKEYRVSNGCIRREMYIICTICKAYHRMIRLIKRLSDFLKMLYEMEMDNINNRAEN